MAAEGPGRRELAELVPDHVFGDVDRHELVAVVHGDGGADHERCDGARRQGGAEVGDVGLAGRKHGGGGAEHVATMEGGQEEAYNQDDATGFIALNALRLKANAKQK